MNGFVGELLGTMILVLFGDGVVAGVLLNRSKALNAGWIAITAGWAFAVMSGVFTAQAFGGKGFINPAGPVAEIVRGTMTVQTALPFIAGEFIGAFIGAVLVWLHYLPHWSVTADPELKLAVFCTGPAIRQPAANLMSEIIGTFTLVFVGAAIGLITEKTVAKDLGASLGGALVWGIGLSLGGTTGYAINPARDLSPRLAHFLLPIPNKGSSDWGYAWIPVVGPIVGAVIAALLVKSIAG